MTKREEDERVEQAMRLAAPLVRNALRAAIRRGADAFQAAAQVSKLLVGAAAVAEGAGVVAQAGAELARMLRDKSGRAKT